MLHNFIMPEPNQYLCNNLVLWLWLSLVITNLAFWDQLIHHIFHICVFLFWSNLGDDDEEDGENGPVSKKRRTTANLNMRKSSNRYMINALQIFSFF